MSKTYSFGDFGKKKTTEEISLGTWTTDKLYTDAEKNVLDQYRQRLDDKLYKDMFYNVGTSTTKVTTADTTEQMLRLYGQKLISHKAIEDYLKLINNMPKPNAKFRGDEVGLDVALDDGSTETVTREELIKYISDRKLVRENEVVRTMYDRYQVAVKLVRSDDNGDTGD